MVEGQVNLFAYRERNLERYFYGAGDAPIEQFVYRLYRGQSYDLGTDKRYIGQLRAITSCDAIPSSATENINYHSKNDWIHYFHTYDECKGVKSVYYNTKDKIGIHLRLTPGIDLTSINVQTPSTTRSFDNSQDVRIGVEVEFVLPINKGKWSFLVEPTYRYYHEINEKYVNFEIDYRSIELLVGLRHGFFLGEYSKIFVDAAVVFDIDLKSTILMTRYYKMRTAPNVAVGVGYVYKKLGIEFRYYSPRNLTVSSDWRTDYQKSCLIVGYRIF